MGSIYRGDEELADILLFGGEAARERALERQLSAEADATAQDVGSLSFALKRERKRNDIQSERIKALTALTEKLVLKLLESGVLKGADIAQELGDLEEAIAPKKL